MKQHIDQILKSIEQALNNYWKTEANMEQHTTNFEKIDWKT